MKAILILWALASLYENKYNANSICQEDLEIKYVMTLSPEIDT